VLSRDVARNQGLPTKAPSADPCRGVKCGSAREAEVKDEAGAGAEIVLDGAAEAGLQVFDLSHANGHAAIDAVVEPAAERQGHRVVIGRKSSSAGIGVGPAE